MNVNYFDGHRDQYRDLTAEEVQRLVSESIADPEVERIRIYRENTNRHQRRKDKAEARKYGLGPNYRSV